VENPERAMSKNLSKPDETRKFAKGKMDVVGFGELYIGRAIFEPGWKWSECVKPIAGTELCLVPHMGYVISGRLRIELEDGTALDLGPGDAYTCPPGHDAWVVGNEPCVALDFSGADIYAKSQETATPERNRR
jgi:uncharacterized cupin superfamily protein